jgi:hypothetical protein
LHWNGAREIEERPKPHNSIPQLRYLQPGAVRIAGQGVAVLLDGWRHPYFHSFNAVLTFFEIEFKETGVSFFGKALPELATCFILTALREHCI